MKISISAPVSTWELWRLYGRKLEEKKIEFRKRIDQKREEMNQNKMTKEEKAEFMHKIRYIYIESKYNIASNYC